MSETRCSNSPGRGRAAALLAATLLTITACASPATPASQPQIGAPSNSALSTQTKTIVFGVTVITAIGMTPVSSSSGGWATAAEIHTNGLITSDVNTRQTVGRLAERVPNLDDGSISLLPDGRMRVVYPLRTDVTWQDGVPFTADDLVFSQRFWADPGIPAFPVRDALDVIDSSEAPDANTFVLYFKRPFYLAGSLGPRLFWPVAQHILAQPYEDYLKSGSVAAIEDHPYWTSQYVGTGPFRVTSFDMGSEVDLAAYAGYFLGRPKVDAVHVRLFPDPQTLFLNILAGQVDIFPENTLTGDLVFELKDRWDSSGAGASYLKSASTRFLAPQLRPEMQTEPANLDVNVRAALYHALDRDTLAEALNGGHREMAAWEILPPDDINYPAVKDGMRPYAYDPNLAAAMLRDAGWTPGTDGTLRNNTDGRPFHTSILGLPGGNPDREIAAFADYWRRIGLDVDLSTTPAAQATNLEFRASFPGWSSTAQGVGDGILTRLTGPAAGPANRWQGNPQGYDDPRGQALVDRYRASLSPGEQLASMKAISDFWAAELPLLVLYNGTHSVGRRTGIVALDDQSGGGNGSLSYGTYTRNAHLWDVATPAPA